MKILIAADAAAASAKKKSKTAGKKSKIKQSSTELIVSSTSIGKTAKRAAGALSGANAVNLSDQPEHSAAVLDALGIALLNRGCLEEGGKLIELALDIRRKAFGPDHPQTAASLNSYARVLRERGDYGAAEVAVNDALRINLKVFGKQGLPVVANLNELGTIQLYQSRFKEAESFAREGLAILEALGLSESDRNTTRLLDVRGRAEKALGKIADAVATYKQLLALDRKQLGTTRHPKYATHLGNFAGVMLAQKNFREAEKYYRQAIDLYLNTLNRPFHPNLVDAYANLGSLLRRRKASKAELEQAGVLARKALQLNIQIRGERHELVGNDYANLGRYQYDAGDLRGAVSSFSMALGIYEQNAKRGRFDAQHAFIAEALTWKGRILVESGRVAAASDAEPLLERAVVAWPVHLGADSLGGAIAGASLGRALFLQNKDLSRALQLLRAAYPILLKTLGDNHPFTQQVDAWLKEAG